MKMKKFHLILQRKFLLCCSFAVILANICRSPCVSFVLQGKLCDTFQNISSVLNYCGIRLSWKGILIKWLRFVAREPSTNLMLAKCAPFYQNKLQCENGLEMLTVSIWVVNTLITWWCAFIKSQSNSSISKMRKKRWKNHNHKLKISVLYHSYGFIPSLTGFDKLAIYWVYCCFNNNNNSAKKRNPFWFHFIVHLSSSNPISYIGPYRNDCRMMV